MHAMVPASMDCIGELIQAAKGFQSLLGLWLIICMRWKLLKSEDVNIVLMEGSRGARLVENLKGSAQGCKNPQSLMFGLKLQTTTKLDFLRFSRNSKMQAAISRAHDYLYDTNYTVANQRDHAKAMSHATQHTMSIHPIHQNMFSALAHYSPRQFTFTANQLNKSLGTDRRDYHRGVLKGAGGVDVGGMNRYRYFKRPLVPYTPSLGGAVVYSKKAATIEEVISFCY